MKKKSSKELWFVQTETGECFGPVDMTTLQEWARDGRLLATYTASQDQQKWQPLTSFPLLEMDTVARLPDGEYFGPVHRAVIDELIQTGELSPDTPVFRAQRVLIEYESKLEVLRQEMQLLQGELQEKKSALKEALQKAKGVRAVKTELAETKKTLETQTHALRESEASRETLELKVQTLAMALEAQRDALAENSRLAEALHDAQAQRAALAHQVEDLETEIDRLHLEARERLNQSVLLSADAAIETVSLTRQEEQPPTPAQTETDMRAHLEAQLRRELQMAGKAGFSFFKK